MSDSDFKNLKVSVNGKAVANKAEFESALNGIAYDNNSKNSFSITVDINDKNYRAMQNFQYLLAATSLAAKDNKTIKEE